MSVASIRVNVIAIRCKRLSEKVHEQRSERGFGRYTEHEKGLWVVCEATLQTPPTLFGQFQKLDFSHLAA